MGVTVMDRETITTSENSASTSPRTVSTEANSVVITSENSASTSPRSVSAKASPEVLTTQSPAATSYSSPGSTTTVASALTTKMLPVKSSVVHQGHDDDPPSGNSALVADPDWWCNVRGWNSLSLLGQAGGSARPARAFCSTSTVSERLRTCASRRLLSYQA